MNQNIKLHDKIGIAVASVISLCLITMLAIVILTGILSLLSPLWAGNDDSGYQVYTLTGDKLMTMPPEPAITTDTPYALMATNMLNLGNGVQKYTGGKRLFTTPSSTGFKMYPWGISTLDDGYRTFCLGWDSTNSTVEIGLYAPNASYNYLTPSTVYGNFTSFKSTLNATAISELNGYTSYFSRHFKMYPYWDTTLKHALVLPYTSQLIRFDIAAVSAGHTTYPTVSGSTFRPRASAVFRNRLFLTDLNGTVIYSQGGVYHNFAATDTEGGIVRLPIYNQGTVIDMVATKDACFAFYADGIYAITGQGALSYDFTIEKISNDQVASFGQGVVVGANDTVYYPTTTGELKKIEGLNISKVATFPLIPTDGFRVLQSARINDRFLAFSRERVYGYAQDIYPTGAYIFDSANGSFGYVTNIVAMSQNGYAAMIKDYQYQAPIYGVGTTGFDLYAMAFLSNDFESTNYTKPNVRGDMPCFYKSAWLSLDGNEGTVKRFGRIEFDIIADTYEVYIERDYTGTVSIVPYYEFADKFRVYKASNITRPYIQFQAKTSKYFGNIVYENFFLDTVNLEPHIATYGGSFGRTFSMSLPPTIGSTNSIQFSIIAYGCNFKLRTVRIYYTPLGSYKTKGEVKN